MPRPLRIQYENAWYHVMNRGANRQVIFKTDAHKEMFLSLLADITAKFSTEVHGYCLMSNHYHLLLCTPLANLARALRHLNGLYTQQFNRMEKRDGPLFRGRYKAVLIDADNYLLQVSRYIHLNPVDARLCQLPHQYTWSSYPAYVGHCKAPSWLQKDTILAQLSNTKQKRSYAQFVIDGIDNEIRKFYAKAHLAPMLGASHFVDKHLKVMDNQATRAFAPDIKRAKHLPSLDKIMEKAAKFFHVKNQALQVSIRGQSNLARLVAIYLAKNIGQYSHEEIAKAFKNISVSGVGAAARRCKALLHKDAKFRKSLALVIELLTR